MSSVTYHTLLLLFLSNPLSPCYSYEKACSRLRSLCTKQVLGVWPIFPFDVFLQKRFHNIHCTVNFAFPTGPKFPKKKKEKRNTHTHTHTHAHTHTNGRDRKGNRNGAYITINLSHGCWLYLSCFLLYCTTSVPGFYQYRPIQSAGSCKTVTTKLELAACFIQATTTWTDWIAHESCEAHCRFVIPTDETEIIKLLSEFLRNNLHFWLLDVWLFHFFFFSLSCILFLTKPQLQEK